MKKCVLGLFTLLFPLLIYSQNNDEIGKLVFTGDFRFRVEQDWNSKKTDGSYREDRTRFRYRARFGVFFPYKNWVSFGARIRTGDPKKQQDPQLTLGDGNKEFGTLPIGFERIYAKFNYKWISGWVGKNTHPFEKQNELFWSDNVFPEGIALKNTFTFNKKTIQSLEINSGHFIINTSGGSLNEDSYYNGLQLASTMFNNKLKLFPAIHNFVNIPNIPDGNGTYNLDYLIAHVGAKAEISKKPKITFGVDFYQNLKDLDKNDSIPNNFKNQKRGLVTGVGLGQLNKKKDFKIQLTHLYMERYAAVDFLAQNDWARWDYSSQGSKDGRLTNIKGLELMGGYAIDKNINIKLRCFFVDQLVSFGANKETGNRIRVDFNIRF